MGAKIKKGDEVLLISEKGNTYIVKAHDEVLSVSDGQLKLKQLIGSQFGKSIKTHLGAEYLVLQISFLEKLKRLKRGPQVILPKDAAMIIAHTGIAAGSKIVDAGTGSGWLTAFLAHSIIPTGLVVSYEIREDFHKLAKENIKKLNLKNVKLKHADVTKGIRERNLDLITLDLLTPTQVPNIAQALKVGGYCVAYVPHLKQVKEFAVFAQDQKLRLEKIVEVKEEEYQLKGDNFKLKRHFPHTGFMVFVRKVYAQNQ